MIKDHISLLKIQNSTADRIIIGLTFGTIFLAIWPFINYVVTLEKSGDNIRYAIAGITTVVTIGISWLLLKFQRKEIVTLILFLLFIVANIISLNFNSEIKNSIALNSNYFDEIRKQFPDVTDNIEPSHPYTHHHYTFSLSNRWKKRADKGPMFSYYNYYKKGDKQAELRPQCFKTDNIAFTDIIKNIEKSAKDKDMTTSKICYRMNNDTVSCRVEEITPESSIRRIRWLNMSSQHSYGIELDFLINQKTPELVDEIKSIINSTEILSNFEGNPDCLSLTEWM